MGKFQNKKGISSSFNAKSFFKGMGESELMNEELINNDMDAVQKEEAVTTEVMTELNEEKTKVPEKPAEVILASSFVAPEMIVEGTIHSEGTLDFRGKITGDLIGKEEIKMSGDQTGNIQGRQVILSNARVMGDITAEKAIQIDEDTKVKGNLQGESVLIEGTVTGFVQVSGLLCIRKNGSLEGDVEAGSISMEEGAIISGQVKMVLPKQKETHSESYTAYQSGNSLKDILDYTN